MQDYTFNIGAHLITKRDLYKHHGLYMGSGLVIEYSRANGVQIVNIEEFRENCSVEEFIHDDAIFDGDTIIKRALSRIGENKYNLIFNNCEHFCNWAITGVAQSSQVQDVISSVGEAVLSAGISKSKLAKVDVVSPAVAVGVAKVLDITASNLYGKKNKSNIDKETQDEIIKKSCDNEDDARTTFDKTKDNLKKMVVNSTNDVKQGVNDILFEGCISKQSQKLTKKITTNNKIVKTVGATSSLASIGVMTVASTACVNTVTALGVTSVAASLTPIVLTATTSYLSLKAYKNIKEKLSKNKDLEKEDNNDVYVLKKRSKLEDLI